MGCFSNAAPAQPNYGQVTRDTLQAQVDLAPQQYGSEATYQPLYTNLALSNLNTLVNGNGSTPGLNQLEANQNTFQRGADIADVQKYGMAAHDAMLAANPESAALLAKLNTQANSELDAGSGLTPDEQRQMQQASRAAYAARGLGGGNQAVGDELLRQFTLGQTLLRQRQQFAQSLIGTNQAVVGDPFAQILSRNSGAIPAAGAVSQNAGPSLFNPQAGMGLAESNYQTQAAWNAAQPTGLQKVAGIMGLANSAAGGIAKGLAAFA